MAGADLSRARLSGADLAGGVLTDAKAYGARFELDLRPAKLAQAGLAGVKYDQRTVWPLDFPYEPAVRGQLVGPRPEGPRAPRRLIPARVVEVVDGDTLRMEADPRYRDRLPHPGRTRLIGLKAPDSHVPVGAEAHRFVERRLKGRRVDVQLGDVRMDDGGRFLVYIWLSPTRTFNEDLLESGHAGLQLRENQELATPFREAELRAKQRGNGLWRTCPVPE